MWSGDKYYLISWSLFPHFPSKTSFFISHFSVSNFMCVTVLDYYFTSSCRQLWKDRQWQLPVDLVTEQLWCTWHVVFSLPRAHLCQPQIISLSPHCSKLQWSGWKVLFFRTGSYYSHMGACSGRPGISVSPVSYPCQLQPACGRGQHPNCCIPKYSFSSN